MVDFAVGGTGKMSDLPQTIEDRLPFESAIEAIYAAAIAPSRWPDALKALADCFGDKGAILIFKRSDGSSAVITNPELDGLAFDYNNNGWWREDFRLQRSFERGFIANLDTITDRHVA